MEQNLKERLVGAAVLIILAVVFIPMFLSDTPITEERITTTNIPDKPEQSFSSRIVPLSELEPPVNLKTDPVLKQTQKEEQKAGPAEPVGEPEVADATDEQEVVVKSTGKTDSAVGLTAWVVQLGSFTSEANAQSLNEKLRKKDFPAFIEPLVKDSGVVYRVRVGPELRRSDAKALKERLKKTMDLDGILVKYP